MRKISATDKAQKTKTLQLVQDNFGTATAKLYRSTFTGLPIDYFEKAVDKLLVDQLGYQAAYHLIHQTNKKP